MKLPSHLKISRHGIFYFRFVIPKSLRLIYGGKTEIKYSLKTRDPVTARREAYILSAETAHIFYKAKQTMAHYDPKAFNPSDASTWPTSNDKNSRYEIVPEGGSFRIKTDPNNPNDHKDAMETLKMLLGSRSVDKPQGLVVTPAPKVHAIKLSQAVEIFTKERKSNKGIQEASIKGEVRKLQHFLKWTNEPHDPPIDLITCDTINKYFAYLLNVDNEQHTGIPLSKITVNTYRSAINLFFVLLMNKKLFPENLRDPMVGTRIFQKNERSKLQEAESWQPFNPRELSLIFKPENLKDIKKPHEFWVPILCLYTGARIDEICQLFTYDIKQGPGFHFLDFHKFDGNSLKNGDSVRKAPLHEDVIALGFLDYVADVKAIVPHGRLFPYLNYSDKDGFSAVPSKAFGRYLDRKTIQITDPKKVCHSFRSTLTQLLQDKSVADDRIENLIGHAGDGTLRRFYGKKTLSIEQLNELVVSKLHVPEIQNNINALKYIKGEYTLMLQNELKIAQRKHTNKLAKETRTVASLKNSKNKDRDNA